MYDSRDLERRRTDRVQVDATGTLRFAADLKVVNLGPRGFETETHERLMVGAAYDVLIHMGNESFTVAGTVVWSKLDRTVHTKDGDIRPVYRSGLEASSSSIPTLERLVERPPVLS